MAITKLRKRGTLLTITSQMTPRVGYAVNYMGKFKPAKSGKSKETANPKAQGAIPCLILIVGGILMIALLFYGMMTSVK